MPLMMRVEMYVPSLPHYALEDLTRKIVFEVGGTTALPMVGRYTNDAEDTLLEAGKVLTTFMEDSDDNRMWLEDILRQYKEDAEQECVMYVINTNEVVFLEND